MEEVKKVENNEIIICMGSSCFSRGNNVTLEIIKEYIKANQLDVQVKLKGALCTGNCKNGPNIVVGGNPYSGVESGTVIDILEHHFG
ncbi:MAG: (2Fe-2S) ferredoxin domain-containing protein [Chitinivibrionales bacterium]